ncbi:hypothetical protein H2200_008482 [Cladophialophora chaetospira]|uniref:Transcription factor domain-containing protein n=1 Tax=Cladophialophora chaetospira TaxID=386627 RepID=A0AA38X697_9EURO|nr:hypothetical protein H2200_008482 [Cladophialophora chaetospira]
MEGTADEANIAPGRDFELLQWASPGLVLNSNNSDGSPGPNTSPATKLDFDKAKTDTSAPSDGSKHFLELSHHAEISIDAISECIDVFRRQYLPQLPIFHESSIKQNELPIEIQCSMAALGALHVDKYKSCANQLHERSKRAQDSSGEAKRALQNQVLMIQFAIWSRDARNRRWAIVEQQKAIILGRVETSWGNETASEAPLLHVENYVDRSSTLLAFYAVSTVASSLLSIQSPICSRDIDINLPCEESLWNAQSEHDWRLRIEELSSSSTRNVSFHAAMRALVTRAPTAVWRFEDAPSFSQYIILCSILEIITLAQKSEASCSSMDDWKNRKMDGFNLRNDLVAALERCKGFWLEDPHCIWQTPPRAHSSTEAVLLLQYMLVMLTDFGHTPPSIYHDQWLIGVEAAAELFCNFSKVGFRKNWGTTISRAGRQCAVACAQRLRHWAKMRKSAALDGDMNPRESQILVQVCHAIKRGAKEGLISFGSWTPRHLRHLDTAVTDIWCVILGSHDW